jgi:alkylated DNA repair protein (DNA oxidative demethylase)
MPLTAQLFRGAESRHTELVPGASLLTGFAVDLEQALMAAIDRVAAKAPFRHMLTPGGRRMSVAMTNCGRAGWISDCTGYRYHACDPESGRPWPEMPPLLSDLAVRAAQAAGFDGFEPDVCLINRYATGSRRRCTRIATNPTSRRRSCRCRSACRPASCSAG